MYKSNTCELEDVKATKGDKNNVVAKLNELQEEASREGRICYFCKKPGHIMKDCRYLNSKREQQTKEANKNDKEASIISNNLKEKKEKDAPKIIQSLVAFLVGLDLKIGPDDVILSELDEIGKLVSTDWAVATACNVHQTNRIDYFWTLSKLKKPAFIEFADGSVLKTEFRGTIKTNFGYLSNVFLVPEHSKNLLSVPSFVLEQQVKVLFSNGTVKMVEKTGNVSLEGKLVNDEFKVEIKIIQRTKGKLTSIKELSKYNKFSNANEI